MKIGTKIAIGVTIALIATGAIVYAFKNKKKPTQPSVPTKKPPLTKGGTNTVGSNINAPQTPKKEYNTDKWISWQNIYSDGTQPYYIPSGQYFNAVSTPANGIAVGKKAGPCNNKNGLCYIPFQNDGGQLRYIIAQRGGYYQLI